MTAFAVARPSPRIPPRVRALLGTVGVVVVATIVGLAGGRAAISHYGVGLIALCTGVPLLVYLWPRPLVALTLVLTAMSVADYGLIPRVPIPGHPPFNTTDLLLLFVIVGTVWRNRWAHWPRDARRIALALALLLTLALIPTGLMLVKGHDAAREAILGFKDLLYLCVAVTIAVEYRGRLLRPALNVAVILAVFVALLSIAAAISPTVASVVNHFNPQSVQAGSQLTGGANRIRLIGLFLSYGMIFPTIAMAFVFRDRWRIARGLAVLPMLGAVGLSLNRNMYFGLAAGLLVAIVLGGPRLRHRALITLVTVAVVVAIVVQSAIMPAAAGKVISRASTGLSGQVLKSSSITTREDEYAHAIRSIGQNPLFGVGWYEPYGAIDYNDSVVPYPRLFVENLYLDFAVAFGLPVLAAFLLFCGMVLGTGLSAMRRSADPIARALIASGIGGLVALLMSCLVGTYMQDINSVPMFGLVCGLIVAAAAEARLTPRRQAPLTVAQVLGSDAGCLDPARDSRGSSEIPADQTPATRPVRRTRTPGQTPNGTPSPPAKPTSPPAATPSPPAKLTSPPAATSSPPVTPPRPMRVILTCDWHLKYALSQASALYAAGAEVTMLIRDHAGEFDDSRAERDAALSHAHAQGVRTLVIPGRMSDVGQLPALVALRRRIVALRPDVVHAHEDADPRALPLLAGLPTVLTVHDPTRHPGQTEPDAYKRWFLEGGRERWFARAEVFVVHSEQLRDELTRRHGQTVAVVPHGIEVADAPLPLPEQPAVGFFGRMEPYKGLDVLAAAMPRVWRQRPDAAVRLAGHGPTDFPLEDPRVVMRRGYLAEAELPAFLARCTFLALPYTQASQSGAGSRAIGHGVPLLVSRLGGLPDLALDASWTVPPGDPDALAAAIVRGLDAGADVRREVLDRVARPRSWQAAAQRTLEVYRELLARRGRLHA